jgi:hypothetical protein
MDEPETAFDNALLSKMRVDYWYKAARVIGQVQADTWDTGVETPADFFLAGRLQVLADAGQIEARGDLRRMRYSEVRLAPRSEK